MKHAFVFPGQGSQKVGMGRGWAEESVEARAVFDEADQVFAEITGGPLSALCWEGPEDRLQLTANTQPALVATSIAIHRALADRVPPPAMVAGHSLGEYSALVAARTLSLADALRLVRRRGEFMQDAVPVGEGAMAAILGLYADAVGEIAAEASGSDGICAVANLNAPVQTVVAGARRAVERAAELAKDRGAKRAVLLPVSAPFHSPLMRPARDNLEPLLRETEFADPQVPVVSNVDAEPLREGSDAREALIRQVDSPVRWVESIRRLADEGVSVFVEIGPGAVLAGLIRRIVPEATTIGLAEPGGMEKLREVLAV